MKRWIGNRVAETERVEIRSFVCVAEEEVVSHAKIEAQKLGSHNGSDVIAIK